MLFHEYNKTETLCEIKSKASEIHTFYVTASVKKKKRNKKDYSDTLPT